MEKISERIRKFIAEDILFGQKESAIGFNQELIGSGMIDSMGLQMLNGFLEKEFEITIPNHELLPENFETIDAIANLVARLRGQGGVS